MDYSRLGVTEKLPPRQLLFLRSIIKHYEDTGLPPTIRELCKKMKISSTNGILCHEKALIKKGYLEKRKKYSSRNFIIPCIASACSDRASQLLEEIDKQ